MSRRYVTGLDADGRSTFIVAGEISHQEGGAGMVWTTAAVPADNSGQADIPATLFSFTSVEAGGSAFMVMEYPPHMPEYWHASDTIDYVSMLSGEIVLMTQTGEVTLKAGDVLVDRGVIHCWRNDSGQPARAAIALLPAHPLPRREGAA